MSIVLLAAVGCDTDQPDRAQKPTAAEQMPQHASTVPTKPSAQPPNSERASPTDAAADGPTGSPSTDSAAAPEATVGAADASRPDAATEDAAVPDASHARGDPTPSEPTSEWSADCEKRYVFKAHGASTPGDTSKFSVEPAAQYLTMFYFARPWSGDVQVLDVRARLDNASIVHHWALYTIDNPDVRDGEVGRGGAAFYVPLHRGTKILHAAGNGSTDLRMPDGVGLQVPSGPDVALALEIHYYNAADVVAQDASGAEICVTSKKRPQEAAPHVVGRLTFSLPANARTVVSGTCRPQGSVGEIHLLSVAPHMHTFGIRSTWTVNRANGQQVDLLDVPFRFQEQRSYALPADGSSADVVLRPGDTLTTTCTFENTSDRVVPASDRTEDEMCQPTVLAWPAGALSNGMFSNGLPDFAVLDCVEL